MKLWAVRDDDGEMGLHQFKPKKSGSGWYHNPGDEFKAALDDEGGVFKPLGIKVGDKPVRIEIKRLNKENTQ